MKGKNMCWSQRPYVVPPPTATPIITANICRCCVITIRKEGTAQLPMYVLKSAYVSDKACSDLKDAGGHPTISDPDTEFLYLNWR
jgi:hypothetical protein